MSETNEKALTPKELEEADELEEGGLYLYRPPPAELVEMESRFLAVLHAIDRGDIALELVKPSAVRPEYLTSNGWRIQVYCDCGDWDGPDCYIPPGETEWREVLAYLENYDIKDAPWVETSSGWHPRNPDRRAQWHWDRLAEWYTSPFLNI